MRTAALPLRPSRLPLLALLCVAAFARPAPAQEDPAAAAGDEQPARPIKQRRFKGVPRPATDGDAPPPPVAMPIQAPDNTARPDPGPRPSLVPLGAAGTAQGAGVVGGAPARGTMNTTPSTPVKGRKGTAAGAGGAAIPAGPGTPARGGNGPPPAATPVDHKSVAKNSKTTLLNWDKKDLAEVIQFVSSFTGRNFILPERVGGKITILSNDPVSPTEVWNVFLAALDANNWALYPIGKDHKYWKLSEKKQSTRANIPLYLEMGQEPSPNEQMVTKLFKLQNVEADQMRNTLNQFTSRDSDFQIFPPDTLIISDLGLNMIRLEALIKELDRPGGSEEVRIIQVQYAGAQELATKLTEIFQAQAGGKAGGHRTLGVADPGNAGQPIAQPIPGIQQPGNPANANSPNATVSVSKIIAEERTNKLIVIANARSFDRIVTLIKQLDVPAGGGGVHVYYLENAKAEEVSATLQALAQGASSASSRRGGRSGSAPSPAISPTGGASPGAAGSAELFSGEIKITADKNTNALVIIASQADYRNLVKVIQQLDIRGRQVFVEAVIMEVNLQDNLDLGVSGHGGTVVNDVSFRGTKGPAPVVFGSELGGLSSLGGVASLASLSGFLAGIQGPPISVPGINLSIPSFGVVLNALQTNSDVNVISTPNVLMSNNSEGEITVGQNVPFQAGYSPQLGGLGSALTGATGASGAVGGLGLGALGLGGLGSLYAPIQRQNVELRLRIKPQINESDFVRLEIDEQTEEIASVDKTLGPTTSKRSAKTTVVAKDQETVVLGGLIQERTVKSIQKIPVLGSIPVLGWLFRNETSQKTKTNLLLFLTPYIIRDQSDFRRIFERKMAERAEFVRRFYGDDAGYRKTVDYDRKPGPLQRMRSNVDLELRKVENGGTGLEGERVIGPQPRGAAAEQPAGDKPAAPGTVPPGDVPPSASPSGAAPGTTPPGAAQPPPDATQPRDLPPQQPDAPPEAPPTPAPAPEGSQ